MGELPEALLKSEIILNFLRYYAVCLQVYKFVLIRQIFIIFTPFSYFFSDFLNSFAKEIDFIICHCGMNRHSYPSGFFGKITMVNFFGYMLRLFRSNVQQVVTVSPRAGTSSSNLDPKSIIQKFYYKIIVNIINVK